MGLPQDRRLFWVMRAIPSDLCCSFAFEESSYIIVSAFIELCWWNVGRRKKVRTLACFIDLPVWYFSSEVNNPVALRYGSWKPLTNLTQTFRPCHLCTFNVATTFFFRPSYIWRTTVHHDMKSSPYQIYQKISHCLCKHNCGFLHWPGMWGHQLCNCNQLASKS